MLISKFLLHLRIEVRYFHISFDPFGCLNLYFYQTVHHLLAYFTSITLNLLVNFGPQSSHVVRVWLLVAWDILPVFPCGWEPLDNFFKLIKHSYTLL
jgi:hypothetical protein